MKVWLNRNSKVILQDDKVFTCDICPCGTLYSNFLHYTVTDCMSGMPNRPIMKRDYKNDYLSNEDIYETYPEGWYIPNCDPLNNKLSFLIPDNITQYFFIGKDFNDKTKRSIFWYAKGGYYLKKTRKAPAGCGLTDGEKKMILFPNHGYSMYDFETFRYENSHWYRKDFAIDGCGDSWELKSVIYLCTGPYAVDQHSDNDLVHSLPLLHFDGCQDKYYSQVAKSNEAVLERYCSGHQYVSVSYCRNKDIELERLKKEDAPFPLGIPKKCKKFVIIGVCACPESDGTSLCSRHNNLVVGDIAVVTNKYAIDESKFCRGGKMVYILSGVYDTEGEAQSELSSFRQHYEIALQRTCQGLLTIMYSWEEGSGTDLDTKTTYEGETVGFGFSVGKNITIDKDDTSSVGAETVSVNLKGKYNASIKCAAGWYKEVKNGKIKITARWNGQVVQVLKTITEKLTEGLPPSGHVECGTVSLFNGELSIDGVKAQTAQTTQAEAFSTSNMILPNSAAAEYSGIYEMLKDDLKTE